MKNFRPKEQPILVVQIVLQPILNELPSLLQYVPTPIQSSIGKAVLKVMQRDDLVLNARDVGNGIKSRVTR